MPDGDIVHSKLDRVFHNAYRSMCCDGFEAEDEAHELAIPLKRRLQFFGDAPIELLNDLYQACRDGIPSNPGQIIDDLARQHHGDLSGIEVAKLAASKYIDNCRHEGFDVGRGALFEAYTKQTYITEFKDRIPLGAEHYNHIHSDEFSDRMIAMEPFIDLELKTFAQKMMMENSADNLRRRRYRGQPIGLHEEAY